MPRRGASNIPDRHNKFFPNGIAATVRSIQYYWHNVTTGGESDLTPAKFFVMTDFSQIYFKLLDQYQGGSSKKPRDSSLVDDIANNRHEIQYYKLRAFADLVKLPTGLFLIFTRFVSDERNNRSEDPNRTALREIEGMRRFLDAAERLINQASEQNELAFTRDVRTKNDNHSYLPKMEALKALSDAYNITSS